PALRPLAYPLSLPDALPISGNQLSCAEWRGYKIGLLICYDLEFPETARALATQGVDLIVITNGNMNPYGPVHLHLGRARAIENQDRKSTRLNSSHVSISYAV